MTDQAHGLPTIIFRTAMKMRLLLRALPLAAACITIDQLLKLLVRTALPVCREQPIVDCTRVHIGPIALANVLAAPPPAWSRPTSPPWIRLQSTGSGYVLVRDPAVAVGLAFVGCILVVVYTAWLRRSSWPLVLGVGLQAGGALSNLLDRVLQGAATDYINVTPTFTFNMADVFLFIGMILAIVGIVSGLIGSSTEGRPAARERRAPG